MALSFKIQSLLDSGSFGCVYQGTRWNKTTKSVQDVAVKILPLRRHDIIPSKNDDMIRREVENWKTVSGHPNIVRLESVEYDKYNIFLVSELCDKGSLHDSIKNKVIFTEYDIRNICKSVLSAIYECHRKYVVHCDIKPANIVLSPEYTWKICDFGNSRFNYYEYEGMYHKSGTPFFMAPEIFKNENYGKNVDMWALGIVIYMLLSRSQNTDIKDVNFETGIPWNDSSSISLQAKDFVEKCIHPDKKQRLTSIEALKHRFVL